MDFPYFLDSRFRGSEPRLECRLRGNDTPQPVALSALTASPAGGEASCFIRRKHYLCKVFPLF
jgi:hypothetical protein